MKKTIINKIHLLPIGNNLLLLLLMVFSVNNFGQIHVLDNTIINISDDTKIYIGDQVIGNDRLTNHEKITHEKTKNKARKKKSNISPKPTIAKKDGNSNNIISVRSFFTKQNKPSTILYAGRIIKVAIVNTINFQSKLDNALKSYRIVNNSFIISDDTSRNIKQTGIFSKSQIHLESKSTRPPPYYYSLTQYFSLQKGKISTSYCV